MRAAVEHPFLAIKVLFKFAKVTYKGLAKNAHRFFVACGNLKRGKTGNPRALRKKRSCREQKITAICIVKNAQNNFASLWT